MPSSSFTVAPIDIPHCQPPFVSIVPRCSCCCRDEERRLRAGRRQSSWSLLSFAIPYVQQLQLPRQDFFFAVVVPFGAIGIFFLTTGAVARGSAKISSPLEGHRRGGWGVEGPGTRTTTGSRLHLLLLAWLLRIPPARPRLSWGRR
jgi:hypothetical protein